MEKRNAEVDMSLPHLKNELMKKKMCEHHDDHDHNKHNRTEYNTQGK